MNREILKLALPNILANISVPLISSVDTALMGHLSTANLSALGIGGMIFMFLYSSFGFLRMGTTGMVAQSFGAKEYKILSATLYRAVLLALLLSSLMLIFSNGIFNIASSLMNIESSYLELAKEYFSIRLLTAPAVFLLFVSTGFFFGMQNARYPFYVTIIINIANIVLSIFFVQKLNLGIAGTAWGTVVAQYIGLIYTIWLMRYYKNTLKSISWRVILNLEALNHFFHINHNIFLRTLALTFSLAFFYAHAAKGGETTLAVMVLLLQFMIWVSFAIDGFANAGESLVGRFYGANDRVNFEIVVKYLIYWGGLIALIFSSIYAIWGELIVDIFTNQVDVIKQIKPLLPLATILPILAFPAFIYDGIFIGMTAVKAMRNIVLSATALYLLSELLLERFLSLDKSLWIAFIGFFLYRGIFQWYLFRRYGWRLI